MGKKKSKVTGKNRLDKFYHLAKEQGYRSRASFKLIQIDAKFGLLNSSRSILDLCAAPGGWMQVAVQRAPVGALVVGVDLVSITPIRGAVSVQEDITQPKCRATVKKLLADNGFKAFDVVLHDGSPNVGGAWAQEATSQNSLVIDSLKLATDFLAPRGHFVTKVFRSQDYNAVVYCLRKFFDKVEVYKPIASRLSSAEIYVIGLKYKAPAKIDPRMLDIKYLFEGAAEPQKVIDVLDGNKQQKRHRDGYEDGLTLVRKIHPASDFVWSDSPVEMLGTTTSISFNDAASLPLKEHALTTEEVITLCDDLSVLGKQDFKHLLKWRINIRKAINSTTKTTTTVEAVKENDGVDEEEKDEDEKLLDEMEELTHAVGRKNKRENKIQAKRLAKDKARKATGMQIDAMQDGYGDNELFSLGFIKGKDDLATVDEPDDVDLSELPDSDDDVNNNEVVERGESTDLDSDEEREKYDEKLEKILDEAYERYVTRKDGSTKQRKRAKKAYADDLLEDTEDADDIAEPYDSDKVEADQEANPLVVPIDKETDPTQEELRLRWFSDNIFVEAVEEGDLGRDESDDDDDDDMVVDVPKQNVSPQMKSNKKLKNQSGTKSPKKSSTKAENQSGPDPKEKNLDDDVRVIADHKASRSSKTSKKVVADELEVVPAPGNSSDSSSSDDDSDYDSDTKAELRALGKKMLGGKRKRQEMEDMAYNKRMFDDDHRVLPEWFVDYEKTHNQPPKLVTKEERLAEKARFNEINARPAKKVAEAKARKKRVAMRNLEKVRKKANSIADQTDINDRSKRRMIDQLYKKATPKKPGKEKVVAKKGVQVRPGNGKVLVDRRMKKDARQHGMNKKAKDEKAKEKGKGKGKGKGSASMGGNRGKR
ncbi:adoMet-dependent rRNA methyltransferase spb1-like [Silene latifolia]|uniref:adoMet-dependent rRNA methyltransferase spb1-like n=1 Tax=Silene latifolia TaxID=37657 RepID=UPI003D78498A